MPEAGRIKHVFVVSLTSPGYEAAFGETSQMPYLATQLRPKGELLSGYTLLDDAGLPNGIAAVSGQPPNASTQADCSTYTEFPPSAKVDGNGVVSGAGCVYPVETLTIADQLAGGRFSWRAYMEGMVDETGKPANCVHPDADARRRAPAGRRMRLRRTPSSTSTRCSTSAIARPTTSRSNSCRRTCARPRRPPNYSYIAPTPCDSGAAGQCPPGAVEGAAAADAFLAKWVPQILASPAYKEDGLLIVTFGAANPCPPKPRRRRHLPTTLSTSGPCWSRASSRRGPPTRRAYDPYSLLRTTEDLFGLEHLGLAAGEKVKSFAPELLGETSGD